MLGATGFGVWGTLSFRSAAGHGRHREGLFSLGVDGDACSGCGLATERDVSRGSWHCRVEPGPKVKGVAPCGSIQCWTPVQELCNPLRGGVPHKRWVETVVQK